MRLLPAAALTALVAIALAPTAALVVEALGGPAGGLSRSALDWRQARLFARSLEVAATATALGLVWGVITAYVIARLRGPLGAAIEGLSYLPLLLPNIVIVIGWLYAVGPGLSSPWGAGLVLSFCNFPLVTITCAQGIRRLEEQALRAAALTAGPARCLWAIWRPALAPYLATGALLVFLLSFSDHGVPAALMVNAYPVEIFAQLNSFHDIDHAVALTLPPLALALSACVLRHLLVRGPAPPSSGFAGPGPSSPACPRVAVAAALAVVVVASAAPLVFLAARAGGPATYVRALRTAGSQVLNSLEAASWGALILTTLAVAIAIAYRAAGRLARAALESMLLTLLVIPGAAVGLGLLSLREAGLLGGLGDRAIVVALAATCRYLVFPALIMSAALVSIRSRFLQAAEVSGAGPARIALCIVTPLLVPSLLTAAALSFVLTMSELSATVLVYPPGGMTLPVRLASLLHFGEEPLVAALCVMAGGFAIGLVLLLQLITNRRLRVELHRERLR